MAAPVKTEQEVTLQEAAATLEVASYHTCGTGHQEEEEEPVPPRPTVNKASA